MDTKRPSTRNLLIVLINALQLSSVLGFTVSVTPSITTIIETQSTDLLLATIGINNTDPAPVTPVNCNVDSTIVNGQTINGLNFGSPFSVGTINSNLNNGALFNFLGTNIVFNADSPFKLSAGTIARYDLTIKCTDAKTTPNTAQTGFRIFVLSNSKPSFTRRLDTVTVNVAQELSAVPNALVYNATANVNNGPNTDVLSFSLRQSVPNVDYFDVNAATGLVTNKVDLRTATQSPVELTIDVSDGFNSADIPLTLTIEMINMNQRPDIIGLPATINVNEDTQTLNLIDLFVQDDGATVNIQPDCTVTPTGGQEVFDLVTRPISLKPRGNQFGRTFLDFETTPRYTITCTVSDGFLSSEGEILMFNVNNINEPPVFSETLVYCTLDESLAGISACNLGFTIRDPEGNLFVTRLFQDENSNRFALTSNGNNVNNNFFSENDRLTFNVNYDVDQGRMPERLTLFVNAVDEFGATGTATVSVVVRDVNDNTPEFNIVNSAIDVDYSTDTGLLGRITAEDDDAGTNGEIDYRLVGVVPPNALNFVSILGNGDIQYIRQYPDSLAGSSVYLSVEAKDRGTPARSSTGTVVVSFIATTTTTTTTVPTTTVESTTIATTTTTEPGFFDKSENVAIFAVLMLLLLLLLLVALYFLFRWCITGSCSGAGANGSGGGMCDNCCQPTPRRVTPVVYEDFQTLPPVSSSDYKGDFWRSGDYYEHGRPY